MKRRDLIKQIRSIDKQCIEKGVFKKSIFPHYKGYENKNHRELEELVGMLLKELYAQNNTPDIINCENLERRQFMRNL